MSTKPKPLKPFDKWAKEPPTHPLVEEVLSFIGAMAMLICIAIGGAALVWPFHADAAPVIVPVMSAGAVVSQRNNEPKPAPEIWKDGPCKGEVRGSCSWFVNGVEQK